jgi:NAD kinase
MITRPDVPLLGINTDPSRSMGILCGKFLYKDRSSAKHIEKIFNQIEDEKFTFKLRKRMNCKITRSADEESSSGSEGRN